MSTQAPKLTSNLVFQTIQTRSYTESKNESFAHTPRAATGSLKSRLNIQSGHHDNFHDSGMRSSSTSDSDRSREQGSPYPTTSRPPTTPAGQSDRCSRCSLPKTNHSNHRATSFPDHRTPSNASLRNSKGSPCDPTDSERRTSACSLSRSLSRSRSVSLTFSLSLRLSIFLPLSLSLSFCLSLFLSPLRHSSALAFHSTIVLLHYAMLYYNIVLQLITLSSLVSVLVLHVSRVVLVHLRTILYH